MIFISLELASLSLYILTAFNKRNARSSEAALKYFLFGGMSAAFLLFGSACFTDFPAQRICRKSPPIWLAKSRIHCCWWLS